MSHPIKLGQRVRALHAEWAGQVTQLHRGGLLTVLTDHRIEITVPLHEVVADAAPLAHRHIPSQSKERIQESKPTGKAPSSTSSTPASDLVDLHLSELPTTYQALADREGALAAQLAYLAARLTSALAAKLAKLIVLHGTGSGMLRTQIIAKLRNRPEVLSIEPDVSGRFGLGSAVVIRLRQQA